jgi:hypothetical protein
VEAEARTELRRAARPRYTGAMDDRARRGQATTRVIRMDEDDGLLDRAIWQDSTMEERIAAVWDLTLECIAWSDPDAGEPRLQRSVCHVERRPG